VLPMTGRISSQLLLPRSMLQSVPVAQSSVDLALIVIEHHMLQSSR
jgi:hypothetical protein